MQPLWLVQRGVASLFINEVEHRMEAGAIGLVTAGDRHWVKNISGTELAYLWARLGRRNRFKRLFGGTIAVINDEITCWT